MCKFIMIFIMSAIKISLIGDKKTGKSTFINFINKNVYSPDLSPSIGVDYISLLISPNLNWKIWDISGDNNFDTKYWLTRLENDFQ